MGFVFDVAVVGGGPSGASCASVCARAGLKTIVIERSVFPRDKVCGDCVNPGCWTVIDSLGLREELNQLPHARLRRLEFSYATNEPINYAYQSSDREPGIAVKRSYFDHMLLENARKMGASVHEGKPVTRTTFDQGHWTIETSHEAIQAKWLIAADGRNSSVCRLNGIAARSPRNRVALQTYAGLAEDYRDCIGLRVLPNGYCGYADVGADKLNLCLVGKPKAIPTLKEWSTSKYQLPGNPVWQSISPIERQPAYTSKPQLLLVGDAARVVEPFTGEGIRYAMESGVLAGRILAEDMQPAEKQRSYRQQWQQIYRGRLWLNCLAKEAVKHPWFGRSLLFAAGLHPGLLAMLSSKVTGSKILSKS